VRGIVVASLNLHGGLDGWGREWDVAEACAVLEADVLVLQENFVPAGEPGIASEVAASLGYELRGTTLATARRYPPVEDGKGFGPPFWSHRPVGLRVAMSRRTPRSEAQRRAWGAGASGGWGLAVLSRCPFTRVEQLDLGQLKRDPAHRRALLVEVQTEGGPLAIAGVHMSHLSDGSVVQYRRLARALPPAGVDAVIAGDMNCWGPPLRLLLPGWRRAVRGRTWPAARPLAQADHLLVRPRMRVVEASVVRVGRTDHRAVRARLELPAAR
jgi:endonuclease/exonuclease/phosphatase family metal-dependent hydrolase